MKKFKLKIVEQAARLNRRANKIRAQNPTDAHRLAQKAYQLLSHSPADKSEASV
jgi:hypothetical protein